jgi:hypothetical protein
VLAGWIASKRMRHWPVVLLSKLTGLGIWRSYARQSLANLDLGTDLLAEQVRSNIEYISTISRKRAHVILRLYNLPNVCRLIITDQVAYVTTYPASDHGRNAPCVVYRCPGPMYELASRMFSIAWSQAVPVDQPAREKL